MKTCSEPGCEGKVVAKGLCSRHYQRLRRGSTQEGPGRPRVYDEEFSEKYGGAPVVAVRLEPDLWEWTQQHGGGLWLRHVLAELRQLSKDESFGRFWARLCREE